MRESKIVIGVTWCEWASHPVHGIRLEVQYDRDENGGNRGRVVKWDGRKRGAVLVPAAPFDDVKSLYRDMVKTAASVGPWT